MRLRWNINKRYKDDICKNLSYFVNYQAVYCLTTVQDVGKVLLAIGIGNILLTIERKSRKRNNILLVNILYVPGLFTNLISDSKFLKKGYYLHCINQTNNSYTNNTEIASAPI